jgi:CPA2 family monovalent cation:H+ antiporter-2
MHDHGTDITALAIVALAALMCGIIMRRLHQPAVLGYIVAGALLGPSGLELVSNRAGIQLLAELGVLMLLFIIGMELSLQGLRAVWKVALVTTLAQIAVALGVTYLMGLFLDWPFAHSMVLGFTVALSSTAVAIKMLEEIGEKSTRVGQVTIAILIAQDLAVVPMMLVVGAFKGGGEGLGGLDIGKALLSIVFLGLLIVYLSRREPLRLTIVRNLSKSVDLMPLAGLAFCFGAATISGLLGLSAAYGAFIAGLVLGNSKSRVAMVRYTAPVQSVLLMVFFLSIGLLLDFQYIWQNLWTVLFIVAFVAIFKTALNIGVIRALGETWPRAFLSGVLLAQMGEFSFVLAALGLSVGVISDTEHRLLVSVTVLSLLGSPIWLEAARRLHRVALLGITSGAETLRLTMGPEASAIFRSSASMEERMVSMASGGTRWVGELLPRRDGRGRGSGKDPRY